LNRYGKGRSFEWLVRDFLAARGYFCVRSPRSGGPVDVLAVARRGNPPPRVLLVQCKTGGRCDAEEWNALYSLAEELDACAVLAVKAKSEVQLYRLLTEKSGVKGVRSPMEPLWEGPDV